MADDSKRMATDLIVAYVSNHRITIAEFATLIKSTRALVESWDEPDDEVIRASDMKPLFTGAPTPPPPDKQTVFPDYIVSLETGQHCKMLKQHLTGLGMTPEQYRAKWNLPPDYPMVAPNFSLSRKRQGKAIGARVVATRRANMQKRFAASAVDPANAPQPDIAPRPAPPIKQSQTAIADALRAAAEAKQDAVAALPLSANAAAYIAPPEAATSSWRTFEAAQKRRAKAAAPVFTNVERKRKFKLKPPPITGRAQLVNGARAK